MEPPEGAEPQGPREARAAESRDILLGAVSESARLAVKLCFT